MRNFVSSVKEARLNFYLLSNDSEVALLSSAFNSKILTSENKLIRFIIDDVNEGVITMRSILARIKKMARDWGASPSPSFVKQPKSVQDQENRDKQDELNQSILLINGKSFDIIKSNEYLFNHFCFLLHLFRGMISVNMGPQQKGEVVRIIKTRVFENSINAVIGDGYDDLAMFHESDISFEISSK